MEERIYVEKAKVPGGGPKEFPGTFDEPRRYGTEGEC